MINQFKKLLVRSYLLKYPSEFCYSRSIFIDVKKENNSFQNRTKIFMQEKTYKGIVQNIFYISPTIKLLRIHVKEADFCFKAGQWVDFHVPGFFEVTGYSMTSPPYIAKENGTIDFAVKYGKFPITHWIHTACHAGEEIGIRVGGNFFYDPQPGTLEAEANLLLIGGGVGINPMVSILCEYSHLQTREETGIRPGKVHLLYSAKTEDELIFKDTFSQLKMELPTMTLQYFITGNKVNTKNSDFKYSRIEENDVVLSIKQLKKNTLCYICGPSTMTDDVASWLLKLGINENLIKYEKWW